MLDRLAHDITLRRLCGWETASQVPDESVFSRAFAAFAQRVHAALIRRTQSQRLVGHILRDATAIEAREKPASKPCSGSMSLEEMVGRIAARLQCGMQAQSSGRSASVDDGAKRNQFLRDSGAQPEAGPVPIIDRQKHGSVDFQLAPHGKVRYRERTTVERVYARLKVEFGGSTVRARPPEGATAAI